jgi:riboflavin kinase/FMN adenylyltransferase
MQVLRQPAPLPPGTAACIGAFDGLHLGHQALLRRARAAHARVALVTFDPHPARVLAPDRAPPLLQSPGQRARVCAALGVDVLVLLPFDRALAATSPAEFAERLLVRGLRPAAVVVGPDFRFGAGRGGGVAELARYLAAAGIDLRVADEVAAPVPGDSSGKLSSTGVRAAVAAGALVEARAMLGRWYAVEGVVVRGAQRGRELGARTANIDAGAALLPRTGVYAGALAALDGDERGPWPAAINFGHNPTFTPDGPRTLEVHALDVDLGERLYGRAVEVAFAARLRDELRFPGPAELAAQISRDIADVRPLVDPAGLAEFARFVSPDLSFAT